MYLLDTNVVSEIRKPKPHGAVLAWMNTCTPTEFFVCAITVAELERGVIATTKNNPDKAVELALWIDKVQDTFQILSLDGPVCREWARMMSRTSDTLSADAMIAATARVHNLTVATRNSRDFEGFGVEVYDPFTYR
ncbi:MAG: type II toxin-antitoxin system VapC family toxin [Acidobacteria bacterium]|nr:type II toxin-antitoxin system VapC family toxin [Acidobacteriota bacterium]